MCNAAQKQTLRKAMTAVRKSIADKKEKSLLMERHLLEKDFFQNCDILFAYLPLKNEAETFLLIEEALKLGKNVAVPRCLDDGEMEFFLITSPDALRPGSYGILEPDFNEEQKVSPTTRSLILVPGLAFDKEGFRLGYGKGYYDRYLAKHPAVTVGLCFADCVKDTLPRGEYDLAVKHLVTEKGFLLLEK